MTNALVGEAIEAFREVQRVETLLAKKEAVLSYWSMILGSNSTVTNEDRLDYVEQTNKILAEYEEKRGKIKVGP